MITDFVDLEHTKRILGLNHHLNVTSRVKLLMTIVGFNITSLLCYSTLKFTSQWSRFQFCTPFSFW